MTVDPLGLARCIVCTNAFEFDAALAWPDGTFVCTSCADAYIERQDLSPDMEHMARRRARQLRAQLDT